MYLDTEAFALKFSHSKRKINNEGRRIHGPALMGFPQNAPLGVKTCLFGCPNFTGFALIEDILRKISMTYERTTAPN